MAVMGAQAPASPSADDFVRTHYAKYEYRIPMRDGVKLFAYAYVPMIGAFKDAGPYPILMRGPRTVALRTVKTSSARGLDQARS
jgi:predicted acyl esterase